MLEADDLTLLKTLGVIDRPSNGAYFHGHVEGKSGLRPHPRPLADACTAWSTPRRTTSSPTPTPPALRLLHYESFSGEDFVRQVDLDPGGRAEARASVPVGSPRRSRCRP